MKKYIFYIFAVSYCSGLMSIVLNQVIEPLWLSTIVGVIGAVVIGLLISQILILDEKFKSLKTRFDTSDYLRGIDTRGEERFNLLMHEQILRIAKKVTYLDEQLAKMTQPSVIKEYV